MRASIVFGLAVVAFAVARPAWSAQSHPIGVAYVNLTRAFSASKVGRTAGSALATREASAKAEIAKRQADLDARREALGRLPPVTPARREQERALARFELDVQRFIEDVQAELFQLRRTAEDEFFLQLQPAVASLAKERGIRIVLSADSPLIAWAHASTDITDDLVARLDTPAKPQ